MSKPTRMKIVEATAKKQGVPAALSAGLWFASPSLSAQRRGMNESNCKKTLNVRCGSQGGDTSHQRVRRDRRAATVLWRAEEKRDMFGRENQVIPAIVLTDLQSLLVINHRPEDNLLASQSFMKKP